MAKDYRVVDPGVLGAKFRAAGYEADVRYHPESLEGFLIVRSPNEGGGDYIPSVSFFCDHRGQSSVRVVLGAIRMVCQNQFTRTLLRVRHDDPQVDALLNDPVQYLQGFFAEAREMTRRVESLRGVGVGRELVETIRDYPRVYQKANRYLSRHEYRAGDFWAGAQAITNTHRKVSQDWTDAAFSDECYETLRSGRVPDGLRLSMSKSLAALRAAVN